ncbi:XRE family transcriptional regulator [Acidovorax sp. NCPPB 3859]|nr:MULTISPECIES: XRE family transcriptional regulator [unclassified Acidovorax]MDA8450458.1 XRE family transcriptional regulator [Acidovorax sp. GBBC 3297]MDA8459868.1 XRE family transcriptional regulator [Acidovorax sp. GBBC 3333]MDA8464904.1 XRE family transcriptional regulator [Acidovorax sp. GBBC 3332]MDA8469973.1 XRE family transcriptional regulator [Acidovorax sp. GBBC 3299]WCM77432.1 XRE family transcriptional regulator [Acidovorax sp. GBBC 712]
MSDSPLSSISAPDVGERLRLARESKGITQKEAADVISVARTTLVAIEQGQRRLRIDELQRLAKLYGWSVNALLRREAVHIDLIPRFRKVVGAEDIAAIQATELLANLARAEVELENLLGVKRSRSYPPERPILPGDVRMQAEQDAQELRQRLGLGFAPITDIVTLLELELGIRVYVRRFDGMVSGVFAHDEALGAFILLNANHPRERRNQTGGHELGHFISVRNGADVLHTNEPENSREERYANAFGRAFLTPGGAVRQKFQEVTAGSTHLTRRHIIVMAHFFGVSREAMVRRLEELGLTKKGTWEWFGANGGITDEQAAQVLGDLRSPDRYKLEADKPTSIRLNLLAAEAYRRELLSEGQLAKLLHLDRVELREMLEEVDPQEVEADGAPTLLA